MVFSSVIFLFYFLPVFFLLYYLLPWRNLTLLAASLLFYAWGEPRYVLLLLVYILLNYGFGLLIGVAGRHRRAILGTGVGLNLGLIGVFKYAGFLVAQANNLNAMWGIPGWPVPAIALPLGISFFTFQGISYLVDIYRGDVKPQRSLLAFAMYKAMFPQLVAGPIVRYKSIAAKVSNRPISSFRLRHGIFVFILGLAQKVLIANTLAEPADGIFSLPASQLTGAAAWVALGCYTLQIYFDFAGYSNMAIGLGHMMGFTFPPNFRQPYASLSVTEFWRRWHMSLSTWFRDYLYVPMGGNRAGQWRTYLNLITVFFLCGLWHGASWTFVLWGLYHGGFLIIERVGLGRLLAKLGRPLRHAYLILAVMVGWLLFRCDSLTQAWSFLTAMGGHGLGNAVDTPLARYVSPSVVAALVVGAAAAGFPAPDARRLAARLRTRLSAAKEHWAEPGVDLAFAAGATFLLLLSAFSLAAGTYNPFIYFRF